MRARNIKPGFFSNEEIGDLSGDEKLLFIGLWCLADSEGFFEVRPKRIASEIFPFNSKINSCRVMSMLSRLMSRHVITFNDMFGFVINFKKHQHPHPHEAKSTVPIEIKKTLINQCNDITRRGHDITRQSRADIMNDDIMNDKCAKQNGEEHFKGIALKIPFKNHEAFKLAYPNIDLESEYKKMDAWILANPKKAPKKDQIRFANGWLGRAKQTPIIDDPESRPYIP